MKAQENSVKRALWVNGYKYEYVLPPADDAATTYHLAQDLAKDMDKIKDAFWDVGEENWLGCVPDVEKYVDELHQELLVLTPAPEEEQL